MKYFIFAMLFMFSAQTICAQDFFVPEGAISQVRDKLPPLSQELQQKASNYEQRRYAVADGRIIALEDEMDLTEVDALFNTNFTQSFDQAIVDMDSDVFSVDTAETQNLEQIDTADIGTQTLVENVVVQNTQPTVLAPTVQINDSLPNYKNRYAMYVADLQAFQQTNVLPVNNDLEEVLKKFSAPRSETLFHGRLN